MPIYVYGCDKHKKHPTREVSHGIEEDPDFTCDTCGADMHRIPQIPRYAGMKPNAGDMHVKYLDHNYKRWKAGKPRFSPYKIKRPPE